MVEPYSFEFEDSIVTYQRATVRTAMEATRIRQKLAEAMGYEMGDGVPTNEWRNIETYADTMTRCKSDAAWWCHSNMTGSEIKAAYEAFMETDEELYTLFNRAYLATLPLKKSLMKTPETPAS